jgi:hypothetical protein
LPTNKYLSPYSISKDNEAARRRRRDVFGAYVEEADDEATKLAKESGYGFKAI